jgi:hypothetical protein
MKWNAEWHGLVAKKKGRHAWGMATKQPPNSPNRLIHSTSHKQGTMLLSNMQQTGISQQDAEQFRLNQNKPKMTNKFTNTEPRHH